MNSQNDIEDNFKVIESLMQQSQAQGASLIVFPGKFCLFPLQVNNVKQLLSLKLSNKDLSNLHTNTNFGLLLAHSPCPYRPDGSIIEDGRVEQ